MECICTCMDVSCPNHMANNNGSCTKCMAKCQALREVPSCLFHMVATREEIAGDYTFEGFARVVSLHQQ